MANESAGQVNTPTYQLADTKLQAVGAGILERFLVDRYEGNEHIHLENNGRRQSDPCSKTHVHRQIAYELFQLTGVEITHEASRKWYTQLTGKVSRTPSDSLRQRG